MDRQKFRKEFIKELAFFAAIAERDLQNGHSLNEVEDEMIRFTSSFYGARLDYDEYAAKKCYFIATYPRRVINGGLEDILLKELCDEIEEEKRVRGI